MEKTCRRLNRQRLRFDAEALNAIRDYQWPGNVRELENAVERAVILSEGAAITPDLLALDAGARPAPPATEESVLSLEAYFRRFVLTHQDRLTETELARRLGLSRKALWERRQRLGIPRPKNG